MEAASQPRSDPFRYEYLDGAAHPKIGREYTHARVQLNVGVALLNMANGRGETGTEWRFYLSGPDEKRTDFVPDAAFVSSERLAPLTYEQREKPPFSPDIAVEVRSPSDDLAFLREKIDRYLRTGCVLVLDVVPARRIINAHAHDGVRTYSTGQMFRHDAAPWLEFPVDAAFEGIDRH